MNNASLARCFLTDDVKSHSGTSTATVVSIVASILVFFSFVLVAAFFYHRQKLRRAKKQLNAFIKRFNIGDPEGLVRLQSVSPLLKLFLCPLYHHFLPLEEKRDTACGYLM